MTGGALTTPVTGAGEGNAVPAANGRGDFASDPEVAIGHMRATQRRLLIAAGLADAHRFGGAAASEGVPYGTVVVWELPPEGTDRIAPSAELVNAGQFGDPTELRSQSLDMAGEIVAELVASRWWHVHGIDIARILRDFIVREVANHLFAMLRVQIILEQYQPVEVHVPLPVRRGYYMADEMLTESVRLVAEQRDLAFRPLGPPGRRARAALEALKWRAGLALTRNRYLRQASLGPGRPDPTGRPPSSDSRGTICVGPCWGAELQSHQPISDALRERGWRLVFFEIPSYYSRPDWRADVLPEGVTPIGAWGGKQAFVRAVRASEELCEQLEGGDAADRHRHIFQALGTGLLDSSYLRARLLRLATREARLAAALHVSGRRMCETVKPDLVFCVKAEGPEAHGIMAGSQAAGVPVIFMPHGLNVDDPRWADIHADLALTYGQQFAEVLARRSKGRPPTKVIGTPKCDAFLREAQEGDLEEIRAEFAMPPRDVWIGVATTDKPEQDLDSTRAARRFADRRGNAGVLVKTHPRLSQPELVARFREAAGPDGVVLSKVDTMRALWCCDVVVTGVSSAAIEALAAGRPVIYVGDRADDIHGYAREGVAVRAPTPSEIGKALEEVLDDKSRLESLVRRGREFAAHRLGPLDGRATERAVAEIERVAGREGASAQAGERRGQ